MRIRIRSPNGAHTLELPPTATVTDLLSSIKDKASLTGNLDLKIGYPPEPFQLDSHSPSSLLVDLPIKLNGEQLIVSKSASQTSSSTAATPIGGPGREEMEANRNRQTGPASGPLSNSSGSLFKEEARTNSNNTSGGGLFSMNRLPGSAPPGRKTGAAPSKQMRSSKKSAADMEVEPPVIPVATQSGQSLVMRIMEDDNSCLFRAVNYLFMRELDAMQELRSLVAQTIQEDSNLPQEEQQYGDAMLGMPRTEYCKKIQRQDVWGGGIELAILSKYFDMEIWSIDVSTGRVDRFNTGRPQCGIVVYSGIHYDCLAQTPIPYSSEADQTVFNSDDQGVLEAANKLVTVLRGRHYYTDTGKFTVRCTVCQKSLVGEKGIRDHMQETGHEEGFEEY